MNRTTLFVLGGLLLPPALPHALEPLPGRVLGPSLDAAWRQVSAHGQVPTEARAPSLDRRMDSTLPLSEALERALAHHPSVASVREALRGADALLAEARGARLPEVVLQGTATRFDLPMVVAPLHSLDPSGDGPAFDRTLLQSRAALSWNVYDGGARSGLVREREAGIRVGAAELDDAVSALLERTVGAYAEVLTARAIVAASAERVLAIEAERGRVERLLEEGRAARVELLRAEASLSEAHADDVSARARLAVAERSLGRLVGIQPDQMEGLPLEPLVAEGSLPSGTAPIPPAPPAGPPPGGTPYPTPPAIRFARERVQGAEAALEVARAARLPSVDVGARLNQFGGAGTRPTAEWDAGLTIRWPLFTGGRVGAAIDRTEAELRRAREDLRSAEYRTDEASDLAIAGLEEAHARRDALERAVVQREEVSRIEALALEAGSGVQSDFLQAQAALMQARSGLAQAEQGIVTALVALARVRGELSLPWILENLEVER